MRTLKLFLLPFSVLCFAVLFLCSASAENADFTVTVDPFGEESSKIDWWYSFAEDRYYLFLPAGSDPSALTVDYSCDSLTVNGKQLKKGRKTDLFQPDTTLTVESNGKTYPLVVLQSAKLPAVFIKTESGSLEAIHADKDHKEAGSATIAEAGILTAISAPLKYIKGRGNTTWDSSIGKKPYNIRFEERIDLFGMGAAKKWSLLANYFDDTLLRNTVALDIARKLEIPYALDAQTVDLYVNGVYLGNYLLCESVQVDHERVDIRDLEKENEAANPDVDLSSVESVYTDPENPISRGARKWAALENTPEPLGTGFLLEFDLPRKFLVEPAGFFSDYGHCIIVKEPEHATKAQVDHIAALYQEFEDAVFSETGVNAAGKSYLDYIDLPSFVKSYLLLEFTMDVDYTVSSFFLTIDEQTGKFKAGPAWDFDVSFANFSESEYRNRKQLFAGVWSIYRNELQENSVFYHLAGFDEFMDAAAVMWRDQQAYFHSALPALVSRLPAENLASALMNGCRWNLLGGATIAERRQYYANRTAALYTFMNNRAAALDLGFADPDSLKTFLAFQEEVNSGLYDDPEYLDEALENSKETALVVEGILENAQAIRTEEQNAAGAGKKANVSAWSITVVAAAFAIGVIVCLVIALKKKKARKTRGIDTDGEFEKGEERHGDGSDMHETEDR